jgi:hypothetical protein
MKTRTDTTISTIIIFYGLFFIIPFLVVSNFKLTTFSIWWIGFWTLIILFGQWKIETFEITENRLTKTNFLGLFKRTVKLENLIRYDKKVIDTDHFKNPINIVKWFSKDKRYLIFRQITILTEGSGSGKMTIDERTVNKEDFNKFYHKIKGYKTEKNN